MGAPAARVQVTTWPAAPHPAGRMPTVRPAPRVSTSTSSAVVAALATATVSVYVSVSPAETAVPLPTSTVLPTVIAGVSGLLVLQAPQTPLPGTTLLSTVVSASASTVAVYTKAYVPTAAPADRTQVTVCPLATQPAGIAPGVRPSPRVSTSTSSAVVAALATV